MSRPNIEFVIFLPLAQPSKPHLHFFFICELVIRSANKAPQTFKFIPLKLECQLVATSHITEKDARIKGRRIHFLRKRSFY